MFYLKGLKQLFSNLGQSNYDQPDPIVMDDACFCSSNQTNFGVIALDISQFWINSHLCMLFIPFKILRQVSMLRAVLKLKSTQLSGV